jgi:hypothetical protein
MSPMRRSLEYLRGQGFYPVITEHRHFKVKNVTLDLWGFCDILAIRGPGEIVAVQTTDSTSVSKRRRKIEGLESFVRVLTAGIHVEVHGWPAADQKLKEPRIVIPERPK